MMAPGSQTTEHIFDKIITNATTVTQQHKQVNKALLLEDIFNFFWTDPCAYAQKQFCLTE